MTEPRQPEVRYAAGGYIPGPSAKVRVEAAGTCPNGHDQYRINGSPHVEHISSDPDVLRCPHSVEHKETP